MNKQLINKYKPEFNHWLNNGKILYKHINSNAWWNNEPWDHSPDFVIAIIINDEYVEFRKALAEGKIIQIYDMIEQHVSNASFDKFGWRDFKSFTTSSSFSKTPDLYRIKPDESKFKAGDFATPLNREINCSIWHIDKVLSCNTLVSGSTMLDPRTVQPWVPVKDEWCWFYDNSDNRHSHLAQFCDMYKSSNSSISTFMSGKGLKWYSCEPFLNSLPSYLKDK